MRGSYTRTFTVAYIFDEGWWVAAVDEIPGAITQARTLEEARVMLQDAISLLLDVRREENDKDWRDYQVFREEITVTFP